MTDSPDLERRLRSALQPTDEDHRAAERMVDRIVAGTAAPSTARSAPEETARRPRWVVPLLAASVAACLALGVGALARMPARDPNQVVLASPGETVAADADALPDVAIVSCDAQGAIRIATPRVRAQRDGVHVRLTAAVKDTAFGWSAGGQQVAAGAHDMIFAADPGRSTMTCSIDGNQRMDRAELDVVDAAGAWLGSDSNVLCPAGRAQPSWAIRGAQGGTRREAVEGLATQFQAAGPIGAIARAPIGYVESGRQTWTIDFAGRPKGYFGRHAVVVRVDARADGRFEAWPDWVCMRAPEPEPLPSARAYVPEGSTSGSAPDVLELSCTDGRLTSSASTVRARPGGVVFRSTSTRAWTLRWTWPGGGQPTADVAMHQGGQLVTAELPPGVLTLSCGDAGQPVQVRVLDPDGSFFGNLNDLPCRELSVVDTPVGVVPGATRSAALRGWITKARVTSRVERAAIGYVAGDAQWWWWSNKDRSVALLLVRPSADPGKDGGAYLASQQYTCSPPEKPTKTAP